MTRWPLALVALLLACSPPSEADKEAAPAARPGAPAPKPAHQPAAPGKSKRTLQAGGYYQYVDEAGYTAGFLFPGTIFEVSKYTCAVHCV